MKKFNLFWAAIVLLMFQSYGENITDRIACCFVVVVADCELFIPNGFSPDGDGINDKFKIRCIENYPDAYLEVYNRWGNLVYKKANYGNVLKWGENEAWWDGRSNHKWSAGDEKLPTATYFYILKLNKGNKLPVKGTIFLNK